MSSFDSGFGGAFGGGFGGGFGGALRSFAFREPRDPLEGLEEWQLLQRAGASEAEVERARLEAGVVGPGGLREASQVLGIEQEDDKKGVVTGFFDFMQRGQSAAVGLVSGLLGLDRRRETAGEGEMFDRPEVAEAGVGLAWDRFVKGLTGQEQYRSADFGVLAYNRETAGLGERFVKSAAGFILDTALDPITYMSMGGSIFGRVRGAQRVFAAAKVKNRAQVLKMIDEVPEQRLLDIVRTTPDRIGASTTKIRQELSDALRARGVDGIPEGAGMDDILEALAQNPAMQRDFAADMIAANMGMSYRGGSSWGLRRYLQAEFGDAGMQLYRSLPADIQGGIRLRVPFSALGGKDPKVLFRLPGTERLSALTDGARDIFRNKIPGFRSLGQQAAGGIGLIDKRAASAYYRMVHDSARKVYGEWDPRSGAIGWLDTQAVKKSYSEADQEFTEFLHGIGSLYKMGADHVSKGRGADEAAFNAAFYDKALSDRLSGHLGDNGKVTPNLTLFDVFGRNPSEVEMHAYEAALYFQTINEMVLAKGMHIWDGDYGRMMHSLGEQGEYFPRILEDMNSMLSKGKGKKKPGVLFTRERYIATLNPDSTVGNWMTLKQIKERYGDVFQVEPERAMMAYITAVTRAMREEQITRNLIANGVAFRGTQIVEMNADAVAVKAAQVINRMQARQAAVGGIGDIYSTSQANQVFEALDGWRKVGKPVYTNYRQTNRSIPDGIEAVFESLDGVRIERIAGEMGGYRVRLADGSYINEMGGSARGVRGRREARVFARRSEAENAANRASSASRDIDYQNRARELKEEFERVVVQDLKRLDELNPLNPANWPLGRDAQDDHMLSIIELISKHAELDRSQFYSRPIRGQMYKEMTEDSGLAILGQQTAMDTNVRGALASRWNELGLLTPAALVDDVQRLGSARSQLPSWMEDFYLPFYAVQKSLMTSQRGPGYVIRNIMGGMWNAYLFGVGAKHWKGAGVALTARNEAFAWAKKNFPDTEVRQVDEALKKFNEILRRKLGDDAGQQMFEYYQAFDAMQLGGRSIRSRTLGVRQTEFYEGLPEDIVRSIEGGDVSKWSFTSIADYVGSRNRWAQFMTRQATESEDFLRFGSFLRGIDDYGFGDGGQLASMYVLASQFDYTDLTQFEREQLKLIMTFYTWARNNIPLQFRALMSEPGKVLKAVRINEALRDAFGEPGDEGEPMPVWLRANMSWRVRSDIISGPMGDAIAVGMMVGEPLRDINQLFGDPRDGVSNLVNWREAANSINPAADVVITALRGIEQSTGGTLPPTEPAPAWAQPLVRAGVMGTVTPDGEMVVSARTLKVLRDTLAPFGTLERLAPQYFGNERYRRRVLTSWASTMFGVPAATLDPFQTGAELRTQQNRMRSVLRENLGEDWDLYTGWVRQLVDLGATANDMAIIRETVLGIGPDESIASLPVERIDYTAARETLEFIRRMEKLQESGIPEQTLRMMWERFEPRTDQERGVYAWAGSRAPLTPEQLASQGLTQGEVDQMSPEELLDLLRRTAGS